MSNIDYEKELNKEQLSAVRTIDGPLRIIAGAGSGKTRTLIYRVAWMLEHGIDPRNILLLTFTNKAADEMMSRADDLRRISQILHIPLSALFGSGQSDENSILAQVEREIKMLSEDELKQVQSYIEFLQMQRK